jgi:hypothetical protein
MKFYFNCPKGIPYDQFDETFVQGMIDRMAMSYHKYGRVQDGFPHKVDAIRTMKLKLEEYLREGNTEKLIDAANYLMIEFMLPRLPNAHYKPTDGSTGRIFNGEVNPVLDRNIPEKED